MSFKLRNDGTEYVADLQLERGEDSRVLIDTGHSIERSHERYGKEPLATIKTRFAMISDRAARRILSKEFNDRSQEYGIYSKSLKYAMVVDWRLDGKAEDSRNHMIIVTILPAKNNVPHFKSETQELIVERRQRKDYLMDEWTYTTVRPLLREMVKENKRKALVYENNSFETVRLPGMRIFLWEGDIYDTSVQTWIEVE